MLININEEQQKQVDEFLDEGILNFKNNLVYEKKIFSKKKILNNNKNILHIKKEKTITTDKIINNNNNNQKFDYLTYNGQSTEMINRTIQALNTGLYFKPKSKIKEYDSHIIQSKKYKRNFFKSTKIAQKKFEVQKERIGNNINDKKINLKKKLFNKQGKKNKMKNRNKSFNYNRNSLKKLTIERNNEINYSSIIQNISTIDDSIKTNKINKTHSTFSIKKQDKENFNKCHERNENQIKLFKSTRSKKSSTKAEYKEKYEKIKAECNKAKRQINNIKNENKKFEVRIENVKNKFDNLKKIRMENLKNELNLKKLKNQFDYSENIKMKQINLIQKIANEIEELRMTLYN